MLPVKQLKKLALSRLSGHWTMPVLLTLMLAVINIALNVSGAVSALREIPELNLGDDSYPWLVQSGTDDFLDLFDSLDSLDLFDLFLKRFLSFQLLQQMFSLISLVVSGAVSIALARFYLAFSLNYTSPNMNAFFSGLTHWWKGILAMLWTILWLWLWALLLLLIGGAVFAVGMIILYINAGDFMSLRTQGSAAATLFAVSLGISFIALFVVYINRIIAYSQIYYVQAEYPEISVSKSLKTSIAITKGFKGSLFYLSASFIGWAILAGLTAGIGYLWLVPYVRTTHAVTYRFLKEKAFERGILVRSAQQDM
jgi:uncharacterized membrane protein